MHHVTVRFGLLLLFFLGMVTACQDHGNPPENQLQSRLKFFSQGRQRVYNGLRHFYDEKGRLASLDFFTSAALNTPNRKYSFFYNADNKLVKSESQVFDERTPGRGSRELFEYDSQGRLVSIISYGTNDGMAEPTPYLERRFEYGTGDKPQKMIQFSDGGIRQDFSFTYAGGNIVKVNDQVIMYDDRPNPFYGLIGSPADISIWRFFSQNNAVGTGDTYSYNERGLPIRKETNRSPFPNDLETFEYEGY